MQEQVATEATTPEAPAKGRVVEVFAVALRLGLTSFGGPVAHLGYFRDEYVKRRRWVDEETYADLVALSQSLPGAASSKLGMSIGMIRAGIPGSLAAWLGFTLPSAIVMTAFAMTAGRLGEGAQGWLHGLQVVAVVVVALAVWAMARQLAPDVPRGALAVLAAIVELTFPSRITTVSVIVVAGLAGWFLLREPNPDARSRTLVTTGRRASVVASALFLLLLVALPLARQVVGGQSLAVFDSFYRSGALVFGGGNVVLPLLQAEVVQPGWVTPDQFAAGFGAAQAVPGPLFTFAAYLGAVTGPGPYGLVGAVLALVAIFLPSFLLAVATVPSLGLIRSRLRVQAALRGINAAVVGVLLAALYQPLWVTAVEAPVDFALVLAAFGLLTLAKVPPWAAVLLIAAGGALVAAVA